MGPVPFDFLVTYDFGFIVLDVDLEHELVCR